MNDKYVAYEAANGEYETFATFEEAEKWLEEAHTGEEGHSPESLNGDDYIAKITHRSVYKETDSKENYHVHTDMCGANGNDCDLEEWPYDNQFDTVGEITMEAIDETD